tara:strand:+ start:12818 stop:13057 length:240 start_codon:yes stop_codon:yes gene_type:complete
MEKRPFDLELDCRGLNCPLPILKTKLTMDKLELGKVLKIISTDPGSKNDIVAWADKAGNTLLSKHHNEGELTFFIQKGK